MAENTNISWTDHSFNPVWGCTKIAPGCDNCYAFEVDKRFHKGANWGPHNKPRRTLPPTWNKVRKYNETAGITGKSVKVFCASMADICDKNWEQEWRDDLWDLVRETPHITWQLLTKRSSLIERYIPADILMAPNVWMGVTVENDFDGGLRALDLVEIECNLRWLSIEPLLSAVILPDKVLEAIDWVVIGGESGPYHRPMDPAWAKALVNDCYRFDIPVFFKQWGGKKPDSNGCTIFGRVIKEFPSDQKLLPQLDEET